MKTGPAEAGVAAPVSPSVSGGVGRASKCTFDAGRGVKCKACGQVHK